MSSLPNYYLNPEEYLALERRAEDKSEYVDGVMSAMAGGSERHNLIAGNLVTELNLQLREALCKVYPSDLKVRVPAANRFFYPDVPVVCGEVQFADDEKDVVLNPMLVVEVLAALRCFNLTLNFYYGSLTWHCCSELADETLARKLAD